MQGMGGFLYQSGPTSVALPRPVAELLQLRPDSRLRSGMLQHLCKRDLNLQAGLSRSGLQKISRLDAEQQKAVLFGDPVAPCGAAHKIARLLLTGIRCHAPLRRQHLRPDPGLRNLHPAGEQEVFEQDAPGIG